MKEAIVVVSVYIKRELLNEGTLDEVYRHPTVQLQCTMVDAWRSQRKKDVNSLQKAARELAN